MKRMIVIGVACLAVVIAGAYWLTSRTATPPAPGLGAATSEETEGAAEPAGEARITEMTLGDEDAPVTVMEYASFTCPHCASFHTGPFKKLRSEFIEAGKVHYIYRDVYFDRFGLWAAMVARCGGQDRFFGITQMLYTQQEDWIGSGDPVEVADNLRKLGRAAGLDPDQLNACLSDSAKAEALVNWFEENADKHEIEATPSLVINGETYSNMSYDKLKGIIQDELAQQ